MRFALLPKFELKRMGAAPWFLALLIFCAPPSHAQINPNTQIKWPVCTGGATLYDIVTNTCVVNAGGGVTWPANGDFVVSNGTNTPAGLAPVNGDCAVGSAGAWIAGSCGAGGGGGGPAYNYVFAGASRNIASTTCQLVSNPPYNISSGTVSGGVATFASTQGGQAGNIFTLQGFGGSYTGLNGQTVKVLSTGFSGSQFEANVTAANGSTGAGGFVCTYSLPTQFSKMPVAVGASVFPLAVGGQTTSTELANFTSLYGAECPNTTGKPAYFMSPTGDQDILDSTSNSTIESNLQGIWAAAHACGYKVVGETAIPVQGDGLAEYAQTQIAQLNTWIIGQTSSMVATPGQNWDILADLASKLSDPYNVSMFIQTGAEADHPTDSFNIAQALIINDAIFNNTQSAYPISNVQGYWFMQDSTQTTSTSFGPDWLWWHNVPGAGFQMDVSLPNFTPNNPSGAFWDIEDATSGTAWLLLNPHVVQAWSGGPIGGAGQLNPPDTGISRGCTGFTPCTPTYSKIELIDFGNGTYQDTSAVNQYAGWNNPTFATAPTGSSTGYPNGTWELAQDGTCAYAASGTWTTCNTTGGFTSGSNANGTWEKDPLGFIRQCSSAQSLGSGDFTFTFPVAFTTTTNLVPLPVVVYPSGDTGYVTVVTGSISTTQFTVHQNNLSGMSAMYCATGK